MLQYFFVEESITADIMYLDLQTAFDNSHKVLVKNIYNFKVLAERLGLVHHSQNTQQRVVINDRYLCDTITNTTNTITIPTSPQK